MSGIGRLRRIDVKAGTKTEIGFPGRVPGHVVATGRRIGCDEDQTQLGADPPIFTFLGDVRMGAGQTRQVPDDGQFRPNRMRRHENRKGHRRSGRAGSVAIDALRSLEAAIGADGLQRHGVGQ